MVDTLKPFLINGMTFTGEKYCNVPYDSERSYSSLEHLRSTGANWVAFTVTWYQETIDATEIFPVYGKAKSKDGYYIYETATPESIVKIIKYGKELGFKVFLKPHIDVLDDEWRGNVNPRDAKKWFESYGAFILYYAKIAHELNVELFSISTELNAMERYSEAWGWPA